MSSFVREDSDERFCRMLMLFTTLYGRYGEGGNLLLKLNDDLTTRIAVSLDCAEENLITKIQQLDERGKLVYKNHQLRFDPERLLHRTMSAHTV